MHEVGKSCLHSVLVLPGLLVCNELPEDDAEAVHIRLLIVLLAAEHLRGCPLRGACL